MAYRALNRHQNASIFKEFNSTQNPLSITNNNFDNFERKKVVIYLDNSSSESGKIIICGR